MKNIANITFVMIGSLIGAGFASGKEIYTFFGIYGINGIYGIILSTLVTGFTIYKVLQILYRYPVRKISRFFRSDSKGKSGRSITHYCKIVFAH